MTDKVIVSKSEIEKLFNRFTTPTHRLETIMQYIDQATHVSGEVVGYVDEFGNFENNFKPWMKDEPNVIWRAVYTSPQLEPDTVPREQYDRAIKALRDAKNTIKTWHGDVAWDIYDKASPEMNRLNQALAEAMKGE